MELEIASPNEEKKMQMARYQAQVAPLAPPEKGMGSQMMDMAKQRAMSGALNTGQEMATSGIKPYTQGVKNFFNPAGSAGAGSVAGQAATNAALANAGMTGGAEIALAGQSLAPSLAATGAGGAGMATLATAVPYVGAGLLAGKVLGLFNQGGQVGPLSTQYHARGSNPDTLKSYIGRNPESIDALKTEYDTRNKNNMDYLVRKRAEQMAQKPTSMPVINDIINQFTNPYPSEYERQLAFNRRFVNDYGDLLNQYKAAKGYEQGGQIGMSKEQAMALMNNQPDPDELYNEIVAESMTEAAQGQIPPTPTMRPPLMVDPLGADTTYSPYNMMRPDNVPST